MIDTAALREKVLDLAIRGKLVPQDPTDEPASVLLERIHEQKLQMVREGKLKAKDVKDDTIIFKGDDNCYYEKYSDGSVKNIQDEIPFELPDTWSWVRLGVIFSHNTGKALKTSNTIGKKLTYITTSNLYWNSFVVESLKEMYFTESEIEKYTIRNGDLLVCEGGDIGRAAIWTFDYDMRIQNHIHKLRAYYPIETKLYYYTFYYYKLIGKINGNGIGIQGLSSNVLHNLIVPLPPIQEQTRITAVVNKCFLTANIIDENEKILQTDIEELKSKILELAIQGKLVPQDKNDEPANVLLEHIRAERKAKLGKKYIESYIYKGDDNCYYENMPKNWVKCRLSDIADLERGITFSASAKETIKTKKNIACIRTANVQDELDLDDLIYVDRAYTKNNERKLLRVGDIIMSSANSKELVGKSCIVKHFDGEMTFGGFVLVIRSIQIIPEFLLICLKYLFLKGAFYNESTQTTNIANISTKTIESLGISLPPLMEQQRIINKITTLFNILKDGV